MKNMLISLKWIYAPSFKNLRSGKSDSLLCDKQKWNESMMENQLPSLIKRNKKRLYSSFKYPSL